MTEPMSRPIKNSKAPGKPKVKRPTAAKGRTLMGDKADEVNIKPVGHPSGRIRESVVVAWGRMNPPTTGHRRLVQEVARLAAEKDADGILLLAKTSGGAKNPLTYSERVQLAEEAFGDLVQVVDEASVKDPITLAKYLAEHYKNVTIVTGADQTADYTRILNTYNGKEFTFESTEVVSLDRSGEDLAEQISATQMREYVEANDPEAFAAGLPETLRRHATKVFEQVKFGLNIQKILTEEATTLKDVARRTIISRRDRIG